MGGGPLSREVSSGFGSDIELDLDHLCRGIVERVLERTANGGRGSAASASVAASDELLQMELRSEQAKSTELHSALKVEREKTLEWMEKHNRERDSRQLLGAEMDEMRRDLGVMAARIERDGEEKAQISALYETERNQSRVLEEALNGERENFRKLKQTLDLERSRAKAASERDAETIIELRTTLEMEREKQQLNLGPNGAHGMKLGSAVSTLIAEHGPELVISKLQHELREERDRVDALKCCLEQERDRSEKLMSASQLGPVPPGGAGEQASQFHQEWLVFHQRRMDALELEKAQLFKELSRQRQLNGRMTDEVEHLRGQLRNNVSVHACDVPPFKPIRMREPSPSHFFRVPLIVYPTFPVEQFLQTLRWVFAPSLGDEL